eukprot:11617696-Ditylum_brightwellii.AAC.1
MSSVDSVLCNENTISCDATDAVTKEVVSEQVDESKEGQSPISNCVPCSGIDTGKTEGTEDGICVGDTDGILVGVLMIDEMMAFCSLWALVS